MEAQELILNLAEGESRDWSYLPDEPMIIATLTRHSKTRLNMSNLCQEITLPTDPIQHIDGDGEIALCILSAINVGKLKNLDELQEIYVTFLLEVFRELIDYQEYPVEGSTSVAHFARRSLGVGFIGLAHYLAKNGFKYSDAGAWKLVHDLTESFQYYLLKSSNEIAKEKGAL